MSPRSKEQLEELRETSRKKILSASLELFGTKGYESTSIAQIARKAGISKGLIYNYFDSKEELLKAMILDLVQEGEKIMEESTVDDPKQTMKNLFRATFKWLREHEKLNRLIVSLILQVEGFEFIHKLSVTKMNEYILVLENLLKQAGFADYRTESRILSALFDGIQIQYLVLREDYPLDEIEEMLIDKYCT